MITRRFLGKTEGFATKNEQRFNQKMLRAYLKGWERFIFGYTKVGGVRTPVYYPVKQELIEENNIKS